jgi:hypothetical protein
MARTTPFRIGAGLLGFADGGRGRCLATRDGMFAEAELVSLLAETTLFERLDFRLAGEAKSHRSRTVWNLQAIYGPRACLRDEWRLGSP